MSGDKRKRKTAGDAGPRGRKTARGTTPRTAAKATPKVKGLYELPAAGAGEKPRKQEPAAKPLRAAECRKHLRDELAKEFPAIVHGFVTQAKKGSVQHFKAARTLVEELAGKRRRRKGPVQQLLEELDGLETANRGPLPEAEGAPASAQDVWRA